MTTPEQAPLASARCPDGHRRAPGSQLDALAAPPQRWRTVAQALMVTTGMASALLAGALYPEARFAFEPHQPIHIGELATAALGPAQSGSYVRARVELEGKPAFRFRRPGELPRQVTSVSESRARFVQYAVAPQLGARFVPPRIVAGRLARVAELGVRHRGLSTAFDALVPGASMAGWVLVDGDEPRGAQWAVALEALLIGFFVFNAAGVWRIRRRRPLPSMEPPARLEPQVAADPRAD